MQARIFKLNYTVLARKYRPSVFNQVVGQPISTQILANSIRMGRIPQAMLISGVRGTGKTTLARIYAKALNCENFQGEPCEKCSSCIEANNLTHPDIMEYDAASNNGVDFVRGLAELMGRIETFKRRIFIFDEAHMFTPSAQAALLKLVEEPPPNTTILLVTTDPQRIEKTLTSRCLSLPLKSLKPKDIEMSVNYILEAEGYTATQDFVTSLSMLGNGSLRDVQQYLDQMMIAVTDRHLTTEVLGDFTGALTITQYKSLAAVLNGLDLKTCLLAVNQWYNQGVDLHLLYLEGVPLLLRDCAMAVNDFDHMELFTGISYELFKQRLTLSMANIRVLTKAWEEFESIMRETMNPRSIWEIFFVKICNRPQLEIESNKEGEFPCLY